MQSLLKLDSIKIKMKAASSALQEADNWTTLSSGVEEVFQSKDIAAVSFRLIFSLLHSVEISFSV